MFGIGRRQKFSKVVWDDIDAHSLNLLKNLWAIHDAGGISSGETYATGFVISGARSSAFGYLADKGAPFRNIKQSDLPSDTAHHQFYNYLTIAFFFALYKRLGTDQWLSTRLGIEPEQLVSLVETYSGVRSVTLPALIELDADTSIVDRNSLELGTNLSEGMSAPKGYAIEAMLALVRESLCGQVVGLPSFKKYVPWELLKAGLGHVGIIVYFNGMFQHAFDDQYRRLKEHL